MPLVLLGLRTALKTDLHCCPAELVYGTTIRVHGEFFTASPQPAATDSYLAQLRTTFQNLWYTPSRLSSARPPFILKDIFLTTHVFIRNDAVHSSLLPPYLGPYQVLRRSEKFFTLNIAGREDVVSIDRLKPAYIDQHDTLIHHLPWPTTPNTEPTQRSRQVHWALPLTL
ncbi:uncharacterized protein LOC135384359 [Ornithodoros turicata]|uniref:uncharacterized protein LOC135384359 n=1 Tax=Ornithodoros turicata TaxID=34597 RepID=UPI0031389B98